MFAAASPQSPSILNSNPSNFFPHLGARPSPNPSCSFTTPPSGASAPPPSTNSEEKPANSGEAVLGSLLARRKSSAGAQGNTRPDFGTFKLEDMPVAGRGVIEEVIPAGILGSPKSDVSTPGRHILGALKANERRPTPYPEKASFIDDEDEDEEDDEVEDEAKGKTEP